MKFGVYDPPDAPRCHSSFPLVGRPAIRFGLPEDRALIETAYSITTGDYLGAHLRREVESWLYEHVEDTDFHVLNSHSHTWASLVAVIFRTEAAQFHFKMRWEIPK